MSERAADPTPAAASTRWATALAALGAWAIVVPYFATAVGLELDVPAVTEVVDHVVPGAVVVAIGLPLARASARGRVRPGDLPWLLGTGAAFLAGFWITSTHVPLLLEAPRGLSPWAPSLVHLSAGPPVAIAAARMVLLRGG